MKYKSELIHEILEQRGHEKSTLHYQSECVKSWVDENKGAYPKLCDYESEWLNYIKELDGGGDGGGEEPKPEPPIGEFPYETVTTNNTATVNNVVPFAYKSAILKGNTIKDYKNNLFDNVLEKGTISITNGEPIGTNLKSYRSVNFIPINGKFKTAKYGIYGDLHVCFYDSNKSFISAKLYVLQQTIEGNAIVTPPTNCSFIKFYNTYDNNEPKGEFWFGVMVENEIVEFEIQFVRMPVLRTSNEDGTKTNILTVNEDVTLRSNGNVHDTLDLLTGKLTQRIDEDGSVLTQEVVKTVDLTVVNQDGETLSKIKPIEGTMHVEVSGTPINPTAVLEVPVEAITQNLNSFIEGE